MVIIGNIMLSSCDNYLDIKPVGQVIPTTLTEYRALLTTAYGIKLNDKSATEFRTDIAMVTDNSYSQNFYSDIEKWNDMSPKDGTREFGWATYYNVIYYSNVVIANKDKITEGSKEDIDQLVGEAYLLRGYMHFILVNLYGQPYTKEGALESKSIPIKRDLDLEVVPSRNTVKEVYAAILSDIESARSLMHKKEWEATYAYRFSTLSTDAMESRVRLYMGDWERAYDAAERILVQKPTLEDLNNPEAKLPTNYTSVEIITAYESFNNDVSLLIPSFVERYDTNKDLRLKRYYKLEENKYTSQKSGKSEYNCTFRTGEIYLNAAEAAAHMNKLPESRTRLLELIEKRYTPEGYAEKEKAISTMNQEELIEEILEERALELSFEGHRWFDLRRTTRPRIEKTLNGRDYLLKQDDSRYTLRIPQSAIAANPGLLN